MDILQYETLGQVARASESSEGTVRRYADRGWVESVRDRYGRRVFPAGTAALVRELKAAKARKAAAA